MSITQLLDDLAVAGIKLSVVEGQLKVRAPKGALTAELQQRLSAQKQELLRLLSAETGAHDLSVLPQIVPNPDHRFEPFPLTDIQQAYWIGSRAGMEFGNFGIHIYTEIDCTDLDLPRFTMAMGRLIARHDMMRAVVGKDGNQRILARVPDYIPPQSDLRGQDSATQSTHLMQLRERLSHSHRSSEVWPGFEVHASLISETHTRLHFSIDLLHIDGGSLQLLFRDLVAYYQNPEATLPQLDLSFRDYVLAEQALHETQMYQRSVSYWRNRLADLPGAPQLPTLVQEEGAQAVFKHGSAILDGASWLRIKQQIKKLGFSPPAVLLTCFAEALATWSREQALTVNVTVFNRLPLHPQVGEILGDFTSMVLLGINHEVHDTFETRVRRVQEHLWAAFEHRHVSGVRVLRELARVRGSASAAMMPIVFTSFLNLEDGDSSVPSSAMRALGNIEHSVTQTPQVWLDHQVIEDSGLLLLSYDAMENMFPAGMIPELFEGYRRLLDQLVQPEAWQQVPRGLLGESDLARLARINATDQAFPHETLYDLFASQVQRAPEQVAVICPDMRLTYGQLGQAANRLGHWLQSHGVGPDKLTAIVMVKGPEQIKAVMGVMAAGGAYLPIDADLPPERLAHLLRDGEVGVVLTQAKLIASLDWPLGLTLLALDDSDETDSFPTIRPRSSATPASLAYVLYTSGSTGQPKGVMIEQRSVVNRMLDVTRRWSIGPGDLAFGVTALHHDLSVFDVFGVLVSGAAVVLPDVNYRLEPSHWLSLMVQEKVSLWNSVPTFLGLLVDYIAGLPESERLARCPASLRWVILAGDWIPLDLPSRLRAIVKDVTLVASGGPTETTIWDIFNEVGEVDPSWSSIPYGKPLANAKYRVLNERLDDCPTWVPGELCIGGVGLARGYWKNAEASKAFFNHPQTQERLYRSGDMGRFLPDGTIEILGRKDFQVKIRGMRIELGEIESTLLRHPAVKRAVVSLAGQRFGEQKLIAYVVREADAREGHPHLDEDLRAFLGEKLPPYMIPSLFMELERLPMGATGKVDRKALPNPDLAASAPKTFVAPRSETEKTVAEIWAAALSVAQLSVEANLIDLGLNSLMAIQVNGKLRELFGYELPLRLLLDSPTVAGLAHALEELSLGTQKGTNLPHLKPNPVAIHEPFLLNPIQQAYWMGRLDTFELGGVAAQYYLEFETPPVDMVQVNRAWNTVIQRHPMMRAVVRPDGQQQILADLPNYEIELLDMRAWSSEKAVAERDCIRERMAHQVMDPHRWPLFEFRLTQTRDDVVRFHFHLDLLIADAWSAQIIFADFRRFMDQPNDAVPLALTFRDYLIADAGLAKSELVDTSRAYWFGRLDSLPAAPSLPLARNPSSLDKPRFVRRSFKIPAADWSALKHRASEAGLTASGLLLSAFGEVLARWSRVPHLCVNVTTFRRLPLHSEVNAIVGDFTSLTLLELDCRQPAIFEDRARAIQERLFLDLDHRYLSGVEVLRELATRQGRQPGALMPVVFTSLLTRYEDENAREEGERPTVDEVFALSQTPQVWLDHQVIEEAGALMANWDAVEDLFPPGLLDEMLAAYQGFLLKLAADTEYWRRPAFQSLPAHQVPERIAYNETARVLEKRDLWSMFANSALVSPNQVALITETEQLTYAELQTRALQVGSWLRQHGHKPQEFVGVILDKGSAQVAAVLGILSVGGVYLPIDPSWPADRRDYILDHAQARFALTSAEGDFAAWPDSVLRQSVDACELDGLPTCEPLAEQALDGLAYAIFTSGSTGRPKGVTVTHAAASNTIIDICTRFGLGRSDRVLALSALTFDLSVFDLFGSFHCGAAMVLPTPSASRDPQHWLQMMALGRVSVWNSVPALLDLLLEHTRELDGPLAGALRLVLLSGDWLPLDIAQRLRRHQPEARVISMGGATEAAIWSIFHEVDELDPSWKSVPYGRPLANQRFYVLDGELRPCPQWVAGELYIAGEGLARDYLNEPEKTAASFFAYPGPAIPGGPKPGERLYRTGDWGRFIKGGTIEFLGRQDEQVKIQGYRIELGEVENVLLNHPEIGSAVALVIGATRESRRLVVACVPVAGLDHEPDVEALRQHAAASLPPYMVPTSFALLDSLPLTSNGKIDRKTLTDFSFHDKGLVARVSARTPIETELARIWCDVLEIDSLDVFTTLFEAGGNSLVAIRLLASVQESFRVELSLQALFESPTIAGLAEIISRLKADAGEVGTRNRDTVELRLVALPDQRHLPFPLSDIQQAYLLGRMSNLELGGVAAHAYFEIEVDRGEPDRIRQVWKRLIERHDMMRVVFRDGMQIILAEPPPFELPVYALREVDSHEREAKLMEIRDELSHQVLPTDRWPLFDLRISLLPGNRMRLHISFDLLIADAWSSQILFMELGILATNPEAVLPPLEISFRDYMVALVDMEKTALYQRSRTYWQERAPHLPAAPELPLLVDPATITAPHFKRFGASLDPVTWTRLQERATKAGITASGLCLAVYAEVLLAWSATPQFTINVTTFNRLPLHPRVQDLIGDFTSLTLLAVDGDRADRFELRARRLQERLWEDLDHRHYSGVQVVRDVASSLGRAPGALMPVVFTSRLFSAQAADPDSPAVDEMPGAEWVFSVSQTPQVWLDMQVSQEGDGSLTWTWDAVEALFPEGVLASMFAAYLGLMQNLASDERLWAEQRLILAPAEQLRSIEANNQTEQLLAQGTLDQLFFAQAVRTPQQLALISGDAQLTYAELEGLARVGAQWLLDRGVQPDERVAIVMAKGWEQMVAVLAITLAGGAYVPLDAEWPQERIHLLLADAEVRLVLTQANLAAELQWPESVTLLPITRSLVSEASYTGESHAQAQRLAYIIFTSGTTGRPKGVAIEHAAAVNTLLDIKTRFGIRASDRILGLSALTFDLSVFDVFGSFSAGATLVLPRPEDRREPAAWAELIRNHQVSVWNSVPALLDMFLEFVVQEKLDLPDSLRLVMLSGDWLPLDIGARLHAQQPQAKLFSLGGATEAAIWSIYQPVTENLPGWVSVPYGKPLANQRFYVLDQLLRDCPQWVPGDLYIGGVGLAREYLGDVDKTAAAFVIHPLSGQRLYRTGDSGRWRPDGPNGELVIEFLGRRDTQVKVQGYRIELGEIEAVLSAHPAVSSAVVEALGKPKGNRRLVAYLVPTNDGPGASLPDRLDELRTHLRQHLPSYMEPSAFVFLGHLPLTANGKVDRKALAALETGERTPADLAAPRTAVERELAALWCEFLNLEQVGIHDGLFELGANSLIAIRLAAAVKERLGVELELRTLFEKPTIAEIGEVLAHLRAEGGQVSNQAELVLTMDEARRYEPFPLNDVQQAYLLGRQAGMVLGSIAAHSYTELDSFTLDPGRLQAIWRRLIEHHDMLRAVVSDNGRQRILPFASLPEFIIPVDDYSAMTEIDRQQHLDETRALLSHQVLPTDQWPLFQIRVSRLSANKIRIHYSFDLLIADAWSSQLLTLQFAYLYAQPEVRLEPLGIGFRDYVLALDQKDKDSRYLKDRNYWRARIEDLPGAPDLPLAVDPATLGAPNFVRRHARLEPETWKSLRDQCAGLGVTPSGLLMAAYAEVLGAWSHNPKFCLNVTTFNRAPLHADINNVVGDFTSLTLLAVDTASSQSSFALRVRQVQEQLWMDLDHRMYSGIEVIRDLAKARGQAPGAMMPVVFTSRLFHDPRVAALEEKEFAYGEVVYSVSQTPQVWIDAQVLEEGGALVWSWDVVDALFPEGLVDLLFQTHTELLVRLANEPALWNSQVLDLLPAAHAQLYEASNDTTFDFGPQARTCMQDLVWASVQARPDDLAVIDVRQNLSYQQLWSGALRLAHQLRDKGVVPNQLVAIIMEKGWEQALATTAVLIAGGAYLPISPEWPESRTERILDVAGVSLILTQAEVAAAAQWPMSCEVIAVDADLLKGPMPESLPAAAGSDDLAYVIFTSGSTGLPKGVAIEHAAAINTLLDVNRRYQVGPEDRVLALSELTFDLSVFDFFGIWAAGGAAIMPPPETRRDPSAWGRLGNQHGLSLWNSVPALLDMLVTYGEHNPGTIPEKLRLAMLSGDWLPVDIADRLARLKSDAATVSMGGATEASIWSIFYQVPVPSPAWVSVPYGKPLANQSFYVLDPQLRQRPLHVPGDLYIGGLGLAREYYGDPEKTAASYIRHPRTGQRLYRTGDMGKYLADGNIEFLGRLDNQVKVQGFRIELGEVEAALARCPDLVAAVAAAPRIGEGRERRLVAYIVPRPGAAVIDQDSLREFLAGFLPEYMIPSAYVTLEYLPLTANGKVDRAALPQLGVGPEASSRAARTPTEGRLCQMWANLLGLETVGIDDNLFDLGGTSVMAIQLVNLIREEFGLELSMRTLFDNLTVRTLALAMARARAGGDAVMVNELPTVVPDLKNRYEPFLLNDIQQAYWVGRLGAFTMGSLGAHYYVEVDSEGLDLDGFGQTFRAVIERHDALRLVFLPDGTQKILQHVPAYHVQVEDLRSCDEQARESALMRTRERLSHQVLPADQWPLFEVSATLIHPQLTRLHLSFDLLLADAWSFQLLFGDMAALAADPNAKLEPLELSFRDYVTTEKQIQETDLYRRSEAYWHNRMDSLPGAPMLPIRDAASMENPRFERFECSLPVAEWDRFQATAAAAGVTTTGALMAAFSYVLSVWSRDPSFSLNVTMFNRLPLHPQVNLILGDFTSMTLVEVDTAPLAEEANFSIHARRIQEQLWTDLDHGHYGGVKVLREMARRQGGAGTVTMPVVFTSRLFKIAGYDTQTATGDRIGDVVYSISQTPQVWIDHQLTEREGALFVNWDVVADLFPAGLIDEAFAAYQVLLTHLAQDPEHWESKLPSLVPATQLALVKQLNNTAKPLDLSAVPARYLAAANKNPQAIAFVLGDSGVSVSYAEVLALAGSVSTWARSQEGSGVAVAVLLERGWRQMAAYLGLMLAGKAVLPLSTRNPQAANMAALRQSQAHLLLTETSLVAAYSGVRGLGLVTLDTLGAAASSLSAEPLTSGDLAYLSAQVGGDGKTVVVSLSQASLAASITSLHDLVALDSSDCGLILAETPEDEALLQMLALGLVGGSVLLEDSGAPVHAPFSLFFGEAGSWSRYLQVGASKARLALINGVSLDPSLLEGSRVAAPNTRLLTVWGCPESGPWSLSFEGGFLPDEANTIPLGKPLANQRAYVLDVHLQPRPLWVPGPLYVAGPSLAEGYVGDARRNQTQFVALPDPSGSGEVSRLFRTDLIGRHLADGSIECVGRDSGRAAVRRSSTNFSETEVLLDAQTGVVRSAVVALPSILNPAENRIVAYLTTRDQAQAALPIGAPPFPGPAPDGKGGPPVLPEIPPPDAFYRSLHFEPIFTPLERLQFKMEHRWRRHDLQTTKSVNLIEPADQEQELHEFINRRSRRRFLAEPVAQQDLAALLEILRVIQPKNVPLPKYRYPSGGGLYPVQVYLSVEPGRVEGLEAGIYYYQPFTHRLHQVSGEAVPHILHAPENRAIVGPSAFSLFFIGRLTAVSPLYLERGRDFCFLESGYMGQVLMEQGPKKLGLCALGGLAFEPIREAFQLEPTDVLTHIIAVGPVPVAQLGLAQAFLSEQLDARDFEAMTTAKAVVTADADAANEGPFFQMVALVEPDWKQQAIFDPIGRLQFKMEKKAIRKDLGEGLSLPARDLEEIESAYTGRRSYRHYQQAAIDLRDLGQWLAALRSVKPADMPLPKYRYPSAGGLYPVQAYLHVKAGAVEGLEKGTYYYDPQDHHLHQLEAGVDLPSELQGLPNQPIEQEAGFTLLLIAKYGAVAPLYPGLARDFCLLEAGYMGQLLADHGLEHGIGLTPLGGMAFDEVRAYFHLDDDAELIHLFVGGAVSRERVSLREAFQEQNQAHIAQKVSAEDLAHTLAERLPQTLVPESYVFVDRLPRNSWGQTHYAALPDPDGARSSALIAPDSDAERSVAEVWSAILGLDEVSVDLNFFEIGGTSVQMVQLHGRLQEVFEKVFPLVDLFEHTTVRSQARFFETEEQGFDMDDARQQAAKRKAARGKRRGR